MRLPIARPFLMGLMTCRTSLIQYSLGSNVLADPRSTAPSLRGRGAVRNRKRTCNVQTGKVYTRQGMGSWRVCTGLAMIRTKQSARWKKEKNWLNGSRIRLPTARPFLIGLMTCRRPGFNIHLVLMSSRTRESTAASLRAAVGNEEAYLFFSRKGTPRARFRLPGRGFAGEQTERWKERGLPAKRVSKTSATARPHFGRLITGPHNWIQFKLLLRCSCSQRFGLGCSGSLGRLTRGLSRGYRRNIFVCSTGKGRCAPGGEVLARLG
jgi:hypothetical protein